MMKTRSIQNFLLAAGLAAVLGMGTQTTWAQDQSQSTGSKQDSGSKKDANASAVAPDARVDANVTAAATVDEPMPSAAPASYAPIIGSDRLFGMGTGPRLQLLYGTSFTGTYDTNLGSAGTGGALSAWIPVVGLIGNTPRSFYMIQYSATVTDLKNGNNGIQAYHQATINAGGEFNRGFGWDASASGHYGLDQLRLLGGLSFGSVQDVAVASGSNSAFVLNNQPVSYIDDAVGLHWHPSATQSFSISVAHTYYFISSATLGHFNLIALHLSYQRELSRKWSVGAYETTGHNLDKSSCTYANAGGSLVLRPTERLTISGGAGPTFGSSGCSPQLGYNASGSLVYQMGLGGRSEFYTTFTHQLYAAVLLPTGQTQDNITVGGVRGITPHFRLRADGGYMNLKDSAGNLAGNGHGLFAGPTAEWNLTSSMILSASYHYYFQTFGIAPLTSVQNRSQALVSLNWQPQPKGLSK
jgi:hypothetical protein